MKKEKDLSVAVLIDGDNASSEKMEDVMGHGRPCNWRLFFTLINGPTRT